VKKARCWAAFVGVACASTATVTRAHAQGGGDEVDLVDGTALHGKITQQVPGSYVVIQTSDGQVESVSWSQVRRVKASGAPLPASPPPSQPLPAPPPPAPPPAAPVLTTVTPAASAAAPDATPTATPISHGEVRFEMGARLGYAFASGDYASGTSLTSVSTGEPGVSGGGAITLDLGTRISRYVYVGGFFSYALLATSCIPADPGFQLSCDAHDIRGGIDAQVHVLPRGAVDPWFGFGLGHEWLNVSVTATGQGTGVASQTLEGWNFGHFMLGVDMRLGKGVGLGPYLEVTSGNFASTSMSVTGGSQTMSQSSDISNQSSHQWVTLGVRGTYEVL
jgi:hypothetical protein